MRAMLVALVPVLVVLSASCTHAPRLTTPDEARVEIRDEYLANNPAGKYNQEIMQGQVAKGMSVIEVLASWGLPNIRRAHKGMCLEYWTYYLRDDRTNRMMSYQLTFDDRVLIRWVHDTNVADLDVLTPDDLYGGRGTSSATDTPSSSSGGKD